MIAWRECSITEQRHGAHATVLVHTGTSEWRQQNSPSERRGSTTSKYLACSSIGQVTGRRYEVRETGCCSLLMLRHNVGPDGAISVTTPLGRAYRG